MSDIDWLKEPLSEIEKAELQSNSRNNVVRRLLFQFEQQQKTIVYFKEFLSDLKVAFGNEMNVSCNARIESILNPKELRTVEAQPPGDKADE